MMGKIVLSEQEKMLSARAEDAIRKCSRDNCAVFLEFLSDREREIVLEKARELGVVDTVITYGGYEDAERTIAGFFPEYSAYMEKDELLSEFPVTALQIECSGFREHSHRDFLGSILGLGLDRSVTGDIVVDEKGFSAVVFVHEKIVGFLEENLKLVGRDGVKVCICPKERIGAVKRRFEKISGTTASFRVDALLSEVLNLSRDKTVKLIESGLVAVNHSQTEDKSDTVSKNDILTVRGFGKFRLTKIGEPNRKGRIRFEVEKYI